jgi:hypothetical protein
MPLYSQKARPFQDKSSRKANAFNSDSDGSSSSGSDDELKPPKKRSRTAVLAPIKAGSSSSILDLGGISSDEDDMKADTAAAAAAPAEPAAAADSDDVDDEFETFLKAAQSATPQKEDAKTRKARDEHKKLIEAKRAALAYSPVATAAAEAIDIDAEADDDDAPSALDDVRLLMLKVRYGKRTIAIKCALSRKLGDLKEVACKQLGIEPSSASFWLNENAVDESDDDKTLRQLGIRKEDTPELQVVVADDSGSGTAADSGPKIAVQLRINGTEKVITATLPCAAPLSALAAHLCSHYKLGGGDTAVAVAAAQAGGIVFTFDEEKLALTATAQEAGLEADDLVDVVISAELLSSGKPITKGTLITILHRFSLLSDFNVLCYHKLA